MLNVNCVMFVPRWLFKVHMLTYAGKWELVNVEMKIYIYIYIYRGYALARLNEALRCKLEDRGFDS